MGARRAGLGPAWKPSTGTLPMYRRQSASLRRSPSSGEMRARRYVISVRVAGARELSRRALPVDGKRRRPSARQRKAEARHRTEDPVADEWIVAVAKLRLEPVVLIKAIASQTPAIAGRRAVSVRRQGRAPRQIGANATRRLARRRSPRCDPAQSGPRTARIVWTRCSRRSPQRGQPRLGSTSRSSRLATQSVERHRGRLALTSFRACLIPSGRTARRA